MPRATTCSMPTQKYFPCAMTSRTSPKRSSASRSAVNGLPLSLPRHGGMAAFAWSSKARARAGWPRRSRPAASIRSLIDSVELAEDLRGHPFVEEPAAGGLGLHQLAVAERGHDQLGLDVVGRVDLPGRPVELAGEGEQLEEEGASGLVGGVGLDLGDLGVDRLPEPTGLVEFGGGQAGPLDTRMGGRRDEGWGRHVGGNGPAPDAMPGAGAGDQAVAAGVFRLTSHEAVDGEPSALPVVSWG